MSPWVERYRPKTFAEIKGQNEAVEKVRNFLEEFNNSKNTKKAIILARKEISNLLDSIKELKEDMD
jgi:hypothetical protein